jgi:AcrR family transcriptional regulator
LLRAGELAYRERGFRGATAAAIARRAGVSTGALYSNFANKEDLLLAVLDKHNAAEVERLLTALDGAPTAAATVTAVARWLARMVGEDARWRALEVEIAITAVDKPVLAERVCHRQRAYAAGIDELLRVQSERFGVTLALAPGLLGEVLLALGDGLGVHSLVDPELDAAGVFEHALARLLGLSAATS